MKRVPLDPKDWLAFAVAAQAHRSGSPSHANFGCKLITRYFDEVPKRHSDDETATSYFDAMLCHVAAAMRGFAVVRQISTAEVGAVNSMREIDLDGIRRLQGFGPLTPDNPWKTIVPGLIGASAAYLIAPTEFKSWSLTAAALACLGLIAFVILAQVVVEILVRLRAKNIFSKAAGEVTETWRAKTANHYATVSVQLLTAAYEVAERYYPGTAATPSAETLLQVAKSQLELLFQASGT